MDIKCVPKGSTKVCTKEMLDAQAKLYADILRYALFVSVHCGDAPMHFRLVAHRVHAVHAICHSLPQSAALSLAVCRRHLTECGSHPVRLGPTIASHAVI